MWYINNISTPYGGVYLDLVEEHKCRKLPNFSQIRKEKLKNKQKD